MKMRRIITSSLVLALGIMSFGAAIADTQKYSSELNHVLLSTPVGEKISMIAHLTDQVDIQALDEELYYQKVKRVTRHKIVVEALQEVAERSQGPVQGFLDELAAIGEVEGYTAYWITNCFVVYGTAEAAALLSERDDIDYLEMNPRIELIEPVRSIHIASALA